MSITPDSDLRGASSTTNARREPDSSRRFALFGQTSMRSASSSEAPAVMNSRRGATSLPMSRSKILAASSASSMRAQGRVVPRVDDGPRCPEFS